MGDDYKNEERPYDRSGSLLQKNDRNSHSQTDCGARASNNDIYAHHGRLQLS